jgi:hypothetical protein
LILVSSIGKFSCGFVDDAGRNGLVPEPSCAGFVAGALLVCKCGPRDTSKDVKVRAPSEGIFQFDDSAPGEVKRNLTNVTWGGGPYLPIYQDTFIQANHMPLLYDQLSDKKLSEGFTKMLTGRQPAVTRFFDAHDQQNYYSVYADAASSGPMSLVFHPVISPDGQRIVGSLSLIITWSKLLTKQVPKNGT